MIEMRANKRPEYWFDSKNVDRLRDCFLMYQKDGLGLPKNWTPKTLYDLWRM